MRPTIEEQPFITVVVPAFNARACLGKCLDALLESSWPSYEIIVVDDASKDNTVEIARDKGVTVLATPRRSGPAAARNQGALQARGSILLFVDADVVVTRETVGLVAKRFIENPGLHALFGSYDADPAEKGFLSQYKNLAHHFVHQHSREEAITFWAGCGAVRKEVFRSESGFDPKRYRKPSVEDIELGYRLKRAGYRILLDKTLQVKHLKKWTLPGLLRADIFDRAVPWSILMLEENQRVSDLNLQLRSRISSCLVGLCVVMLALSPLVKGLLWAVPALVAAIVVLNLDFYRFLLHRRGPGFTLPAFFMHVLYYFYSGLTFVLCWSLYRLSGRNRASS